MCKESWSQKFRHRKEKYAAIKARRQQSLWRVWRHCKWETTKTNKKMCKNEEENEIAVVKRQKTVNLLVYEIWYLYLHVCICVCDCSEIALITVLTFLSSVYLQFSTLQKKKKKLWIRAFSEVLLIRQRIFHCYCFINYCLWMFCCAYVN